MNSLVTALPGLVPIFVSAGGVNALAGVLFCLKLDLFHTGGCMKQTYDDGHRTKPNNENRKSN